jgi:ferredoxin
MPDKNNKTPSCVPGMYYADTTCIGCTQCVDISPACFKMGDDGMAFVYNQPKTTEEKDACAQAKDVCPVEAIGDDGQ